MFGRSLGRRASATFTASVLLSQIFISTAAAVTSGPNYAGTGSEAASSGTVAWNNEANITADDTSYATSVLGPGATSEYLVGSNFGFAIPSNATIDGITVTIARQSNDNTLGFSIKDVEVKLMKGGVIGGDNNASGSDWPTSIGAVTYGGATDDWGETWTPADINNSNFGVALSAQAETLISNRTASVDYIRVAVDYSLGATVTPATNGTAIPNNTAGGAYTTLTGPVLAEAVTDNIGNGTIILSAPSGFQFDTGGAAPTVMVTCTSGCGPAAQNINGIASGANINAAQITRNSTSITLTITDDTDGSAVNTLTWSGIRVRPTAVMPLASGNITNGGTSVIDAVSAGSNFGPLASVSSITTSSTALVSGTNPSTYGGSVTFTATVTGSTPTGTVQFKNGASNLGAPVTVSGGQAQLTIDSLTAATHSITAEYSGDVNNTASTSNTVSQVVNPAPLSITANSHSKVYGDTYIAAGTEFSTSGLQFSDAVTSVMLMSSGYVGTATTGTYSIVPSSPIGTGLSNYTITYVDGTLTVTPKNLTITANSHAKLYGDTYIAAGTEFTTMGLTNGDDVVSVMLMSSGYVGTANATTYTITPSSPIGTGLTNYTISFVDGTLTVNPRGLTITLSANNKVYDGNTSASYGLNDNRVNADVFTTTSDAAAFDTKHVGNGKTVTVTNLAISGGASANYFLTSNTATTTADITPRQLVVSITAADKQYDGTTAATAPLSDDRVAGDDLTITADAATFADANVGVGKTVTRNNILVTAGADMGNYSPVNTTATDTADITAAPMTVTANNASKTYGSVLPFAGTEFFTTGTFYGADAITSVTLTSAGAGAAATVVGSPYTIVPSAAVGTGVSNYNITYVNGTLTVSQAGTATSTVLNAPSMTIIGEVVQFDVVVSGTNVTGTVSFKDNNVIIGTGSIVMGAATFSTSALAVGNHPMTATYNGDSNNLASTSAMVDVHVVDKDSPTTVTTVGVLNPAIVGTNVTLTATVSGAYLPTGTVEFYDGVTLVGTGSLNGSFQASLTHMFTTAGTHNIKAHYLGDGNNYASISAVEVVLAQVIDKDSPDTVTNVGVADPAIVGDNVIFTATVTGAFNPTGNVGFYSGAVLLGTGTLVVSGNTATFNHVFTSIGTYSITAHYAGDSNNNASISAVEIVEVQTVIKASPNTSTVLTVTPSTIGDMVTMTATVNGGYLPAGDVIFRDGATVLATVALSGNTATFQTDLLAVGDHHLTAEYVGNSNNNGSLSPSVHTHVVQKMTTASLFASLPNPNSVHIDLLMGVNVTGYNPTGTVEFFENGVSLGSAPLIAGRATFSASPNLGSYSYHAVYSGDMNNFPSTSNSMPVEIVDTPDNESGESNGGAAPSNGSGRGAGLTNAASVATFTAQNNGYGNAAPPAFGGDDVELSRQELIYICAVKRSVPSGASDEFLEELAEIMGQLIGRSTEFVFEKLEDRTLCDSVNEARNGKGRFAKADLIAFPVALDGLPTSSNETWNACIRGDVTLEQVRSNPDRNEYRRAGVSLPRTCGHYHTKNSWFHPDLAVHFEFNGRGFILPVGYIAIPQKGVAQK